MALGSENIQPTGRNDLFGLDGDLGLDCREHLVPTGFEFLGVVVRVQSCLVQFRHRDEFGVSSEHDVGTATGHVRCDRDRTETTRLGHDCCFARVVLGVQHFMTDSPLREVLRQPLALFDRHGSDQNGLTLFVALRNVLDDLAVLRGFRRVNQVRLVDTNHGAVRRNRDNTQLVGRAKFCGFRLGGTGHAGQLLVQTEIVLKRDGGESLVLGLDLDAFFGFDRLVDSLVVTASRQNSAGVLVDNRHLAVHHDVVLVATEQFLGLDRVVEERNQRGVRRFVKVVNTEVVLDLGDSVFENTNRSLLLVEFIVNIAFEFRGNFREFAEPAVRFV